MVEGPSFNHHAFKSGTHAALDYFLLKMSPAVYVQGQFGRHIVFLLKIPL